MTRGGQRDASGRWDYTIVGHEASQGAEDGGRTAMENLLAKNPDINVVYTINEPAAYGAFQALGGRRQERRRRDHRLRRRRLRGRIQVADGSSTRPASSTR